MNLQEIRDYAEKHPCQNRDAHRRCVRQDRDRLLNALEAVEGVHEPTDAMMYAGSHGAYVVKVCTGCGTDAGNWQRYPCPTIRAIQSALEANCGSE